MNKDFTISGRWWLPGEAADSDIPGELHHEEGSLELRLHGAFHDASSVHFFASSLPKDIMPVIHGRTSQGTEITLLSVFYRRWQLSSEANELMVAKVASSILVCNSMLIGWHMPADAQKCFTHCEIALPNLAPWLADEPFKVSGRIPADFEVHYKRPPKREFELPANVGALQFVSAVTPPSTSMERVVIKHEPRVTLRAKEPQGLSWIVNRLRDVESLFTLLFGQVAQATLCSLQIKWERRVHYANLYLPRTWIRQHDLGPRDFLVRFHDVRDHFEKMLKSWFAEAGIMLNALNLVFASLQHPGHFLETRFMPFVQAIEVYARAAVPGHFIDSNDYNSIREQIIASIPKGINDKLKESIERSLLWSNERTLQERFHYLIDGLDPDTTKLFCMDPEKFVRGVVKTRNYLTHYSSKHKAVLDGLALHWATVKLQTMVKMLLLKRIGMPEEAVRKCVQNNWRLLQERQTWQKYPEVGSDPMPS